MATVIEKTPDLIITKLTLIHDGLTPPSATIETDGFPPGAADDASQIDISSLLNDTAYNLVFSYIQILVQRRKAAILDNLDTF